MSLQHPDALQRAVTSALEAEVEKLREASIRRAVEAYEADLRESIGRLALRASRFYEIETRGEVLTIRVKLEATQSAPARPPP